MRGTREKSSISSVSAQLLQEFELSIASVLRAVTQHLCGVYWPVEAPIMRVLPRTVAIRIADRQGAHVPISIAR